MQVKIEDLKKLRALTDAGVSDCREALEAAQGDMKKAEDYLKKKGLEKAAKKSAREVKIAKVFSYVHHTGRLGALVAVACETDFVAKTDRFNKLGQELAMHIAASSPANVEELLKQEYVRDAGKTVETLVKETVGVLGENIQVVDFKILTV